MSKNAFVAAVAVAVLLLDQASKWYIQQTVSLYQQIPIFPTFFHITHARNTGGAFSLFAGASDAFRIPFFFGATVIAIAALVYFVWQVEPRQRLLQFALAGILGGAVGNLIDRLTAGEVTDFLLFHWRGYHWPAFNVADSFITIGVGLLLAHSLFERDQR